MLFLIALLLGFLFLILGRNALKKHPGYFYSGAIILSLAACLGDFSSLPSWLVSYGVNLFRQGAFATVLFLFVMYAGALPNGSKGIRSLMPIRGELSILASLLILGHNLYYLTSYSSILLAHPERLTSFQLAASCCTILALLIMLPLMILSFPSIRRKWNAKKWKRVQRLAYGFYALVYLHLLLLYLPPAREGKTDAMISVLLYSLVFLTYFAMRVQKYLSKRKHPSLPPMLPAAGSALVFLLLAIFCLQPLAARKNASASAVETVESLNVSEKITAWEASAASSESQNSLYADGTYTGSGEGYSGTVTVTLVLQQDIITELSLVSYADDEAFFTDAWNSVSKQILEKQQSEVDAASGATYSSYGIMDAVADALQQAKEAAQEDASSLSASELPITVTWNDTLCTASFFAMDTYMQLSAYADSLPAEQVEETLTQGAKAIQALETALSVTLEGSELWRLNHADGEAVTVSHDTAALLQDALALCEETNGAFDISVYPISQAWGFTTGNYQVPSQETLDSLLPLVDYHQIVMTDDTVQLAKGMEIDLGGIAKGYAGDLVCQLLKESGIEHALLSLGGNVQTIGTKQELSPWRIAVQHPEDSSVYLGVLDIAEACVITSGSYERNFTQDGITYSHIMDPTTGYPVDNGILSVTIIGEEGFRSDALSTALMVMGTEQALAYWREHPDFDLILVTDDQTIYLTESLADSFTLRDPSFQIETVRLLK